MTAPLPPSLAAYREPLLLRMRTLADDARIPDAGSDAALLLDALCAPAGSPRLEPFVHSGRALAEQGGHLERRLAGLREWAGALADGISVVFAEDAELRATAQARLTLLVADVAAAVVEGFQAGKAEQARAEAEQARRGVTRLQALQRVNAAANSTLDLDQTLSTTARAVADEMNAALCVIFLFDDVTRTLELRATSGHSPRVGRHFSLALGEGFTGWVAEHGHPMLVSDVMANDDFAREAAAYSSKYAGLLSVPIIFFTVEKLEGVISVLTHEPHMFSEEEVSFLEIVAGQLAMSIENGRLYEQTDEKLRRKVHELSTLHRVSAMVASTLVVDSVLRMIVTQAVLLSGAERSVLFELDAASERLTPVATHGFDDAAVALATVRVGECCAGRVVRTGQPSMQVDCLRTDGGCFLHALPQAIGDQHSVLCAPLSTRHGAIGALCVTSSQRHLLDDHQLQLVMTFANVAAIAIENARLFEQTREGMRANEVLLREMHHRVKNNLQQVASILNMQRRRTRSHEVEQILSESVDRIQGIAATHDLLSRAHLGVARVDEIARKIAGIVRGNLMPPQLHVHFSIGNAPYPIASEQATTLAIVLNELIANAIEHGFEGLTQGEIRISSTQVDDHIVVRVADNGRGLPPEFSLDSANGMGLQLVRGLVQSDLHGSVRMFKSAEDPDLGEGVERLTDPSLRTVSAASAVHPRRGWTVAELTFAATRAPTHLGDLEFTPPVE